MVGLAEDSRCWTSAVTRERRRCWNKGIYANGGSVLAVVVPLVVREGTVAWSRSVTGAVTMPTLHSTAFRSYISGYISVMEEVNAAAGRLSFERAQLLGRVPRRVL